MANIIDITNQIGKEVHKTLLWRKRRLYYQETALLYSLTENMLKYMVAMKNAWDENSRIVDNNIAREGAGEIVSDADYEFDFGAIRDRAASLTFHKAIEQTLILNLISQDLHDRLNVFRKERNSLVHELYLFEKRNSSKIMREKLREAKSLVKEVVKYFELLIYDEIDVDTESVLQTLDVK